MKPTHGTFIPEFEPIRGLAALSVALFHSFFVLRVVDADAPVPAAALLFNSLAPVNVFFVLSGIVLGLALDRQSGTLLHRWRRFLVRRVFRIYPVIALVSATICIYLLLAHEPVSHAAATSWFNGFYTEPLTWKRVLKDFLLVKTTLNPVAWAVGVEMAMMLGFPLLHFVARRLGLAGNLLVLAVLVTLAFSSAQIRALLPDDAAWGMLCGMVLPHAYKFYLGLLLPRLVDPVFIERVRGGTTGYVACAILLLLLPRVVLNALGYVNVSTSFIETCTAAMLLAPFCLTGTGRPALPLLTSAPLRWLGRVSYSFYLWHFIVLYVTATVLLFNVPAETLRIHAAAFGAGLALVSVLVTGVLAEISYRGVEIPFAELGRRVARSRSAKPAAV